ncbi:unnamed protein product [Lasius platythorax]|uniref:Uncharacterized protein n=1 Tax=Lasius platythorax TaxID=488582 RepID=A0AAV2NJX4_9HYME
MPLSNTSTTKLDNFDGNRRSARRRRLKLADESAGNSLPTFHQVCKANRDPTRSSSFFTRIRCAFTHAHIPKLFAAAKFLSEILYATGKHRHDSRICAQACVLLLPPANKYADVSATAFYSAVKMIKKGIDCPTTLKCWNTYGKAPPPTTSAFCLESMRIPHPPPPSPFPFFSR